MYLKRYKLQGYNSLSLHKDTNIKGLFLVYTITIYSNITTYSYCSFKKNEQDLADHLTEHFLFTWYYYM